MPVKKSVGAAKAPAKKPTSAVERALVEGYRSGLEEKIAADIAREGYPVHFECLKLPFVQPATKRTYTPDFPLLWNGIVVETKGRFLTSDRQKHKMLKEQYPDLDIRFVFSNSKTKLSKGSPTSYGMWCEQYGFQYADKAIPAAWLAEPPEPKRMAALSAIAVFPKPTKQGA